MKLKELLLTLTPKEWKDLIKFSESPYFNTRSDIVTFLKSVYQAISKDNTKKLECCFSDLEKEKTEQEARLFFSYTKRMVERFLIQNQFDSSEDTHSILLLRSLRHRKLHRQFEVKLRQTEQSLQEQPYRNAPFYDHTYQLHQEQYYYTVFKTRLTELPLQSMSDNLDYSYILNKIKLLCQVKSHLVVYQTHYDIFLENEITDAIAEGKFDELPAIKVYFYAYQLFDKQEDKSHFHHFLEHLRQFAVLFNHEELRELYLMAINFCIQQFNKGRRDFLEVSLELYRVALEKGFLLQDGFMSRFTFRNIIANSLSLNAFEWTENFIRTYSHYLENEDKKGIVAFSWARFYFEKNEFQKAMEYLIEAEYKDTLLYLSSRILLIKIYYELQEIVAVLSLIETTKIFVRRQLKIGYHRQVYFKFLKLSLKLSDYHLLTKAELEKTRNEIRSENRILEREWLLKKFV